MVVVLSSLASDFHGGPGGPGAGLDGAGAGLYGAGAGLYGIGTGAGAGLDG